MMNMVTITKKIVENQPYYSLKHSIRKKDGTVDVKEKYIGKKIPKNIEEIKWELLYEIYEEKWFPSFYSIKINYQEDQNRMPKSAKEKEIETFMMEFTYSTQRIEGSTLTLRDIVTLLERGITPKGKSLHDVEETVAHKDVFYEMLHYDGDLSLETVLSWHEKLFNSSKPDIAGKTRQHQVQIRNSEFIPPAPEHLELLIEDFFNWYNENKNKLHPVVLAGLVHLRFVTIHLFSDGNGRISRLMMNFILKKYNYPMIKIEVRKRSRYMKALERSQIKDDANPFLNWFFRNYVKKHKIYL